MYFLHQYFRQFVFNNKTEVKDLNKKFFLVKLIEQLEEEKVDSLIDVVKGMVYPSDEEELSLNNGAHLPHAITEYEHGEHIVTQNINDIFR